MAKVRFPKSCHSLKVRFSILRFYIKMERLRILIALLPFSFLTVKAQQKEVILRTPFVQNFKPIEYFGEPQVNCVAVDSRGVLYFGHKSGLSIFDGADWRFTNRL